MTLCCWNFLADLLSFTSSLIHQHWVPLLSMLVGSGSSPGISQRSSLIILTDHFTLQALFFSSAIPALTPHWSLPLRWCTHFLTGQSCFFFSHTQKRRSEPDILAQWRWKRCIFLPLSTRENGQLHAQPALWALNYTPRWKSDHKTPDYRVNCR